MKEKIIFICTYKSRRPWTIRRSNNNKKTGSKKWFCWTTKQVGYSFAWIKNTSFNIRVISLVPMEWRGFNESRLVCYDILLSRGFSSHLIFLQKLACLFVLFILHMKRERGMKITKRQKCKITTERRLTVMFYNILVFFFKARRKEGLIPLWKVWNAQSFLSSLINFTNTTKKTEARLSRYIREIFVTIMWKKIKTTEVYAFINEA